MKLILVSIDVGTAGNQLLHDIKLTRAGSGHEHRLAAVAHGPCVGAVGDQLQSDFRGPHLNGDLKGPEVLAVARIGIGAGL